MLANLLAGAASGGQRPSPGGSVPAAPASVDEPLGNVALPSPSFASEDKSNPVKNGPEHPVSSVTAAVAPSARMDTSGVLSEPSEDEAEAGTEDNSWEAAPATEELSDDELAAVADAQAEQQSRESQQQAPILGHRGQELLCEGYLVKVKENSLQNRKRHFRLTLSSLSYYKTEGGPKIAGIASNLIEGIEDVSKLKFRLKFSGGM